MKDFYSSLLRHIREAECFLLYIVYYHICNHFQAALPTPLYPYIVNTLLLLVDYISVIASLHPN